MMTSSDLQGKNSASAQPDDPEGSSAASVVWLNGRLVEREEALLSAFDAGFQHGVGLFETMLAVNGRVLFADRHIERLIQSAKALRLSDSLRPGPLTQAVQSVADRFHAAAAQPAATGADISARIRLTITGGNLNLLQSAGKSNIDPTILIVAQPATRYPDSFFERGVHVAIADSRVNPLDPTAGHKTLNYWPRLIELQRAAALKRAESIWFGITNHLACGSVSNVFLVKDGTLFTPIARGEESDNSLPAPVLPGITRRFVIDEAEKIGIGVSRQMLTIDDLLNADEVFLTNSSWGVLPVIAVEKEAVGDAVPGEVMKKMRRRWLKITQ